MILDIFIRELNAYLASTKADLVDKVCVGVDEKDYLRYVGAIQQVKEIQEAIADIKDKVMKS
jgi:hypothetical protein